jgi:pimeloyl-ACP methyl ester carboxylesterase
MTLGTAIRGVRAHRRVVVLLVLAATCLSLCVPAVALANANFVGTWEPNTGGGWTVTSQEPSGACTGTSVFVGYTFTDCHVSGNEYEFYVDVGSYESRNHGTIEGNKVTGEFNDTNGTNQPYVAYRVGAGTSVVGQIFNQKHEPEEGVAVTLSGTSDESESVNKTTMTNVAGAYSIEVPAGTYSVTASGDPTKQAGGELAVALSAGNPECTGTAKEATCTLNHLAKGEEGKASFTYTQCAASVRETKGKEPTGCPVIFIPGILGSRIDCNAEELYFALPKVKFGEMLLKIDGETDQTETPCNEKAETPSGEAGLLTSVGPQDVYGGMFKFLKGIATNGLYAYPYDWRRSVPAAEAGLEKLVNEVLKETGAKHVVLVAHSMGGLVTQDYINTGENAEKVSRAVTIGTPYWGAPKSLIALLNGRSNEFATEKLDVMFGEAALQEAVRNYLGLFWLYPSTAYGPWLQVEGAGFTNTPLAGSAIGPWVASLGGNAILMALAQAGHATLDGFKPHGVNYQIIVGTGLPTITAMKFALNPVEPEQLVSVTYGNGDATVPAISQTQGAYPGTSAPVGVHYVCDISHADETEDPGVQGDIKEFVESGASIPELSSPCLFTGTEVVVYKTGIVGHGGGSAAAVAPAGSPMTIEQAVTAGLVQVFEHGGQTILVTSGAQPVTLKLSGHDLRMRVKSLSATGESPARFYGPVSGTITIEGAKIAKGTKSLRAIKVAHAPRVRASVKRHGRRYLVTLRAGSRKSLEAIYYRLGKAARHVYSKPLLLTRSQLRSLRFAGVSTFGAWEPTQWAPPPR